MNAAKTSETNKTRCLDVAIVGAGFGGLGLAIRLKQNGIDNFRIFEQAEDVGGVWRDNRYPGITCDVPSHAYRFSFAPNPDWSRVCSSGEEILAYMRATAEQHDIPSLIRFGEEVTRMEFTDGRWHLQTASGFQADFNIVVTATGVLHHPVFPDIPGRDTFQGTCFHTARWQDDIDLTGKRVGIIGTGSTAIQMTGALVDTVAELKLFQRTAQWIWPLPNKEIPEDRKQAFRDSPEKLHLEYLKLTGRMNDNFAAAVVGENPEAYDLLARECEEHLDVVTDPELRAKLTPDYKVGCKRLIMSDNFYQAIQRPNATLVTDPIAEFCPAGLRLESGTMHELDVILMATGFDTHRFFRPMEVIGPDGQSIEQAWEKQNQSYMTVAVPGFPNWFMIGGPSSPIGNFSWLLTAETQFAYVLQLIERVRSQEGLALSPRAEPTAAYNAAIHDRLPETIWATGCSSWYIDAQGNIASWPWTFDKFVNDLKSPDWADWQHVKTG